MESKCLVNSPNIIIRDHNVGRAMQVDFQTRKKKCGTG